MGLASWAFCQSFVVMQVACQLCSAWSNMYRSQLYVSVGLTRPLKEASCMAQTVVAVMHWYSPVVLVMHLGQTP